MFVHKHKPRNILIKINITKSHKYEGRFLYEFDQTRLNHSVEWIFFPSAYVIRLI